MISQDNKQAMRNPWLLGWLGILAVVITVNIIFIVTAFKTYPGLVDDDYYDGVTPGKITKILSAYQPESKRQKIETD